MRLEKNMHTFYKQLLKCFVGLVQVADAYMLRPDR